MLIARFRSREDLAQCIKRAFKREQEKWLFITSNFGKDEQRLDSVGHRKTSLDCERQNLLQYIP